jgi:hypothetical protein
MRSLNRAAPRSAIRALLTAALLAAAAAAPAAGLGAGPASAAAQSPAGGSCHYQLISGGYEWVCTDTTGSPGAPGTGGGGGPASACTLVPLSQQQAQFLGLQWPAPKGHTWEAITCPGTQPFGGVTLVNDATGAPAVTPQQLSLIAIGELKIPDLRVSTAPPRNHDGLVGLPEWFWIPADDWGTVQTPPVTAGPVWAVARAVPTKIIFNPGGGLGGVTCDGPGTAYQPAVPLADQHTDCSYLYQEPSAGQPGNTYAASVTVLWNISWFGSGVPDQLVATGRPATTAVPLRVAAGEALVTS